MLLNLALNHSIMIERPSVDDRQSQRDITFNNELSNNVNRGGLLQTALLNPSTSGSGLTNLEFNSTSTLKYNASSPDELALVNGARYLGAVYLGRDDINDNVFKISIKGY